MRSLFYLIALLTLCPAPLMQAELGCMDNSWHLSKPFDAKEYHLVSCTCPCSRHDQSDDRGQCRKCKHFRDPRPYIIIEPSKDNITALGKTPCAKVATLRKKQVSWRTH